MKPYVAASGRFFLTFVMVDSENLRSRAARLLAAAMKAYENGNIDLTDNLITRATQYLEEADTLDRRRGLDVPPRAAARSS
jgi:hypothetical protein